MIDPYWPAPNYDGNPRRFRMALLRPTLIIGFWTACVFELLLLFEEERHVKAWLVARLIVLLFALVSTLILVLLFWVKVTPSGIKFPNWPILIRKMKWDEVIHVRSINLGGLRFLVLYSSPASFGDWIPLFLAEPELFCKSLEEFVPKTHPLWECQSFLKWYRKYQDSPDSPEDYLKVR
ncbi:MAG: hypothetical protein N2112_09080 [Gemmataceae bacterium]|jgi:hypothetical protein|nr:hypothetical protein [Gemmataceae bacterium]